MRRNACVGALVVFAALAAGCSSSGPSGSSSSAPSSTPAPSTPSTSAAPSTSTAPSTPAPSTSAALSKFENDPAVKALRVWAAQIARTVNAGNYTDAKLNTLMTPELAKQIKEIDGGEQGHYEPGPLPFTPIAVTNITANSRDVKLCVLAGGFSQHPDTHKVWSKRNVIPVNAAAVRSNGRWVVSKFQSANFSCAGVHIPEQSW